jgi:hypothetical protein
MKKEFIGCIYIFLLLLTARPAYAYLDAGSGSMLLQLLLGGLAGLAVVLKVFWNRIRGVFRIAKKADKDVELTSEDQ